MPTWTNCMLLDIIISIISNVSIPKVYYRNNHDEDDDGYDDDDDGMAWFPDNRGADQAT